MFPAYPKIWHMGTAQVESIFDEPVQITEKLDGSQFAFGKVDGTLRMRSKGQEIIPDAPPSMFEAAVNSVAKRAKKLPEGTVFYGEYLRQPKHNTLAYKDVPVGHIALFAVHHTEGDVWVSEWAKLKEWANHLVLDVVPLIHEGKTTGGAVLDMLPLKSVLGNVDAEGIVIKNFKPYEWRGMFLPVMSAKFVSEKFKEVHQKSWKQENTTRGNWETYKEGFRTEARWLKAIQHLRDSGTLQTAPQDIGPLIKEIQRDITEEEKENIMRALWGFFGEELLRRSIAGFPQWYKEQLAKGEIK